jgi:YaiO family outer membrane protein
MRNTHLACGLLAACLPGLASAQAPAAEAAAAADPAANRYFLEASLGRDGLTRGLPEWTSQQITLGGQRADKTLLFVGERHTERYALKDRETRIGGSLPLGESAQLGIEAASSPTHQVLAKRYGLVELNLQPATGWSVATGWKRSVYGNGLTGVVHAGVDRYIGNERFSYTHYAGGPDGSARTPSHRLQWAHYYSDADWFGLALVSGRETERNGSSQFLTTPIRGYTLSGRHTLVPGWAAVWEASRQRQGALYTRSGAQLGIRRDF